MSEWCRSSLQYGLLPRHVSERFEKFIEDPSVFSCTSFLLRTLHSLCIFSSSLRRTALYSSMKPPPIPSFITLINMYSSTRWCPTEKTLWNIAYRAHSASRSNMSDFESSHSICIRDSDMTSGQVRRRPLVEESGVCIPWWSWTTQSTLSSSSSSSSSSSATTTLEFLWQSTLADMVCS